jgi:hypothetical protein
VNYIYFFKFLRLIIPVQFPLHEPYFDLTPIKVTHTKVTYLEKYNYLSKKIKDKQPNLLRIHLSAPDE